MKRWRAYIPLGILGGVAFVLWCSGFLNYLTWDQLRLHEQDLHQFVSLHLFWAIAIYGITYVLVVALSIPGATFMTLLGGVLLGQWVGTGAVVVSATLGAMILFLSVRLAADAALERAGPWLQTMRRGFQENALSYLLTLRLVPLFPFVAVNLVAAILKIPLRTFLVGTFFGIMPGSFVYVSLGVALREAIQQPLTPELVVNPKILLALTGLGLLSLIPVVYKKLR